MADVHTIAAEPRERAGKGSARAARRDGRVPAVIYGDKKTPIMITLSRNELVKLINQGGFLTRQYDVKFDGATERVLPRDVQLHPVTDEPLHIDFLRLAKGATVVIEVPVNFINEEDSPGLKRGGVLNIVRREIEMEVPATAIPENIEVDLAGLDINDAVKISAVSLPEGCKPTITDRDFTIAGVVAPSGMKSEEEEAAEEELEGIEGEAEGEGEAEAGEAQDGDEE